MPIDGTGIVRYQSSLDPVQLLIDPNSNVSYIACQASNEIRVLDMVHDSLLRVIPLYANPACIGYSSTANRYLFSCPDDITFISNQQGLDSGC